MDSKGNDLVGPGEVSVNVQSNSLLLFVESFQISVGSSKLERRSSELKPLEVIADSALDSTHVATGASRLKRSVPLWGKFVHL